MSPFDPVNPSDPPALNSPVTITFAAPRHEQQSYQQMISEFSEQNSDIRVKMLVLEDILAESSGRPLSSGEAMRKVAYMADTAVVPFITEHDVNAALLYDLTPLIDSDAAFQRSDYYTGTLEVWGQEEKIYGLPRSIYVSLLAYNKNLVDEQRANLFRSQGTWNNLLTIADSATRSSNDKVSVYGLSDSADGRFTLLGSLYESNVFGTDVSIDEFNLHNSLIKTELERVDTAIDTGAIYTRRGSSSNADSLTLEQLILDQKVAIWRQNATNVDMSALSFPIGTLAMPLLPKPFSSGGGSGYVMSRGTQNAQAAWRWLSFSSRQPLSAFEEDEHMLPARQSLAAQSAFWQSLDAESRATVLSVLQRPSSSHFISRDIAEVLTVALQSLQKDSNIHVALQDAQTRLDELQLRFAQLPTSAVDDAPFVVATPLPDTAPLGAITITIGMAADDIEQIKPIAAAFQRDYPDIFLEFKNMASLDAPPTFAVLAATTDCFTWFGAPSTSELTASLDLQPFLDSDATIPSNEYVPAVLAPFRSGKALHGIPYIVGLQTIGYNPRLFAESGLQPPSAQWTHDDFLAAAEALTQNANGVQQYGYAEETAQTVYLEFFVDMFGASLVRNSGSDVEPNFTDPKVKQAVTYYIQLLQKASPHRQIQGYGGEKNAQEGLDFADLLVEERVAMWFNVGAFSLRDDRLNADDIAVAPLPLGDGMAGLSARNTRSFYISAQSTNPQACWEWFRTVSGNPTLIPSSGLEGQSYFPARRSVAESIAFRDLSTSGAIEVDKAYREALSQATSLQQFSDTTFEINLFWFYRAVDRALQEGDLDRHLADAQQITEAYFVCTRDSGTSASCPELVDPTYGTHVSAKRH
jgi:ABC-type glycerol-3-phosphate transport system substrate-binding protein